METFLFRVEERFLITRIGLVLVPEVPEELLGRDASMAEKVAAIRLRRPDGSEIAVRARFKLVHHRLGGYQRMCVPEGVGKEAVPIGTEVWLVALE